MSKKHKFLIAAIAVSIAAAAVFFFLERNEGLVLSFVKAEAPRIGSFAPDFKLKDLNGRTVRLADFRGKNPIFLNFWASWCPACRQEAPENEKMHGQIRPKGLKVVAVSVDQGLNAVSEVKKFMEEFKVAFTPLLDPRHEVLDLYGVTAIPTTFLIDRKGKTVAKEVGPKKWTNSEWLSRLESLFN